MTEQIEQFIARWERSSGAQMATSQTFLNELTDILGVDRPKVSDRGRRLP